jgi:vitamin B12 transporter
MRRLIACAAVAVTGWGLGSAVDAQEPRDTTELAPIVVTATRTPLPLNRLGARVTVLTAADLEAAGYATVAAALEGVAGLSVARTAGPGSATSVFLRGGEGDYVKVLVDGVPLNEPGGAYDFAHLTTDNVERIEIVRGPTSVLYGSDAVAGVVHLVTRTGASRTAAHVRGGTYGTFEADAEVTGGSAGAWYAVAGGWRRADGLYPVNSGYENASVAGRLRIAPASGTSADFTVRSVNATYRYPTDGAGNVVDTNQHQLTRATTLGLTLGQELHPRVRAHLALRSNAIGGGIDDAQDGPGDTLGAYAYRSQRDLDRRLVDLWVDWRAASGLTVTGGGAYEHQRDRSTDEGRSDFGPYGSATDVRRHNWGAYAEAAFTRGPVTVTAGGRLDRNERFGTFVTWRAGASALTRLGLRGFASAGTGFKEPTFFEQFGGSYVVGNPDLTPERTVSWEVGLEQSLLGTRARLSAGWFSQRFRDLIQYSFSPVTPDGANYVNIAAANADGLELEGTVIPVPGLRLDAQYTYLRSRVTGAGVLPDDDAAFRAGDRLLRRPTHAAALRARWDAGPVSAHGTVRWTGSRADADFATFPAVRVDLPAHTVVDVGVSLRPFRARTPLGASAIELHVRNAFDEEYQMAYGFPAQGRVVLVGLKIGAGE